MERESLWIYYIVSGLETFAFFVYFDVYSDKYFIIVHILLYYRKNKELCKVKYYKHHKDFTARQLERKRERERERKVNVDENWIPTTVQSVSMSKWFVGCSDYLHTQRREVCNDIFTDPVYSISVIGEGFQRLVKEFLNRIL